MIVPSPAMEPGPELATGLDLAVIEPFRVCKPDLWQKLIGIYLETTPESLETLEQALAKGDCTAVHMTAHTLKSSSANMGAARLSDLCRQLETASGDGNLEDGPALVEEMRREFDIVAGALVDDIEDDGRDKISTA